MIATFPSAALCGVDAYRVDVEVDVSGGLPAYSVVGLAAPSIKEGAARIRSALHQCGQELPAKKITVNLAPADRRKDGAAFDLPIAVGIVTAGQVFLPEVVSGLLMLGELGLDGGLRPVRGVLAAASLARDAGLRGVLVPRACAAEAAVVDGIQVFAADHLSDVLRAMLGETDLPRWAGGVPAPRPPSWEGDFFEVRGQTEARRAVEIAMAGGHNLLLYGPPGIGKTMIARRVPTILPEMSRDEAVEVTKIYSAAGLSPPEGLIVRRPFRAPHHSCSVAALVGGGYGALRPGEISLAHRGVLFLDELPEFIRSAVEALRQPLEERVVRIGRVHGTVRFPAAFHLIASANPCPCGWFGSTERACTCSATLVARYRGRMSGPLLDRIDLQVRVPTVTLHEMRQPADGEPSAPIRERVQIARERQARRLARWGALTNAEMSNAAARATCKLTAAAERHLAAIFAKRSGMTARGVDRIVRSARTISDLAGTEFVSADAVNEAATFRALDLDPIVDPRLPPVEAEAGTEEPAT